MMSSKRSPLSVSLLVLAIASLATGCAASRREAYVQEKTGQHAYHKPIADVWPQVLTLLKEKGLELREAPGAYEISTDWQMVGAPSSLGTSYVRYLVRGKQAPGAMSSVEIYKQNRVETADSPGPRSGQGEEKASISNNNNLQRDLEMEWELLQRVEPESAKSLRAEAENTIK